MSQLLHARSGLQPPQRILAVLGVLLVLWALIGPLVDGWHAQYAVHLVAGVAALVAAPRRRATRIVAAILTGCYLVMWILDVRMMAEAKTPGPPGFTMLVLHVVVFGVATTVLLWPTRPVSDSEAPR